MAKLVIEVNEDSLHAVISVDGEPLGAVYNAVLSLNAEAEPVLHVRYMKAVVDSGLAKRGVELLRKLPYCNIESIELMPDKSEEQLRLMYEQDLEDHEAEVTRLKKKLGMV